MGCGDSGFEDRLRENSRPLRPILKKLQIGEKEVRLIYKVFEKIDSSRNGEISIDEFFDGCRLPWSKFGERAFLVMEISGDKKLSFAEWFVGMCNYCTSTHNGLVRFAFDLFDVNHSNSISRGELRKLYKMVKGPNPHTSRKTGRGKKKTAEAMADDLMAKMDKDGDGQITWEEFKAFEKSSPSLLFPAFRLQGEMRKNVIGPGYWNKLSILRQKYARDADLIELNHKLTTGNTLNRAELKSQAKSRSHGQVFYEKGAGKTVNIHQRPDPAAPTVGRLKWKEDVEIFDSRKDHHGRWYCIDENGTEDNGKWVKGSYIKIDHTFDKIAKEAAAVN